MKSNDKKYKIENIIKYFESYSNFLDSEYSKEENQKNQRSTRRTNNLGFLLSFVMILLTLVSFAISSINSTSSQLEPIDSMCSEYYLSYFNNSNFTQDCFNLTSQRIVVSSSIIKTNLGIFDILKWVFIVITIFMLAYLVHDSIIENRFDKDLEKLNKKIILIRSIILSLYSLKLNHPENEDSKEVQDVLKLFDKCWGSFETDFCLEEFNKKLLALLNKFLKEERNEKR